MNWTAEILGQLEFYWETSLRPRLIGLGDDEFFWEPVEGCWSVRRLSDGTFAPDREWPEPVPPPVTTVGWRLGHIVVEVLEMRVDHHFGGRTMMRENAAWPGSADEALRRLERAYTAWCAGVRALDPEDWDAPVGAAEPPEWSELPFVTLALHINREVIHHSAEIALMRDLYRSRPGRGADAL
ncbi:DinB family protein [Marinactinospora rubrisoli]|uniref:DinB family protein n=1 Tax=Marinactinospora rubrisoli TaxID=2715399 RepID=A0ABW2KLP3_9ACTN